MQEIIYQKNGKIIKRKINFINENIVFLFITKNPAYIMGDYYYEIKEEITDIVFKNVVFPENTKIKCNEKTKITLDNCTFFDNKLYIEGAGSVNVINPNLSPAYCTAIINIDSKENVTLKLGNEALRLSKLSVSINSQNIDIDDKEKIKIMCLIGKNIKLNGLNIKEICHISAKNLTLENSLIDANTMNIKLAKDLILKNSDIYLRDLSKIEYQTIICDDNSEIVKEGYHKTKRRIKS